MEKSAVYYERGEKNRGLLKDTAVFSWNTALTWKKTRLTASFCENFFRGEEGEKCDWSIESYAYARGEEEKEDIFFFLYRDSSAYYTTI